VSQNHEAPPQALEAAGVTKAFGPRMVLKGIDLSLKQGDFLTVFGPNGAGKTTLMKILSTVSRPTAGRVSLCGLDSRKEAAEARRRIGMVSHESMLYGDLTACENLRFFGKMYDVPDLESRINTLLAQVGLTAVMHGRVATFSHGMLKRLSIARAFVHDPPILLLDEPETGLDQEGIRMLSETLRTLGAGKRTVVMTTHSLERGLRLCSQVAILARGRIVYQQPSSLVDIDRFGQTYLECTEARS